MELLVAHIGYPKSGTTFLQNNVFPHFSNLNYIEFLTGKKLFRPVVHLDDIDYDEKEMKLSLNSTIKVDGSNLISLEQLVGPIFPYPGQNKSQIANRLKNLGFSKIIITIRNQFDAIDSCYRQYIHEGGVLDFKSFYQSGSDDSFNRYDKYFDLNYYNYNKLIGLYVQLFGKENVLVILNEDLKNNEEETILKLEKFFQAEYKTEKSKKEFSNVSITNTTLNLLRTLNLFTYNRFQPNTLLWNKVTSYQVRKLLQKTIDPILKTVSKKENYVEINNLKNEVNAFYSIGNVELSTEFNLDLKKYNYPF